MNTYSNNKDQITNSTFTPISFSNPESKVYPSRLSISYFNKTMKISIYHNPATIFMSFTKAKILYNLITQKLLKEKDVHNVCVELTQGLLKVSDGVEFGSDVPCISITQAVNGDAHIKETIYQFKSGYYSGAYNYDNGKFNTEIYDDIEMDAFLMVLDEYYKASAYATPAFVMEASMYKRDAQYKLIRAIAEKVGAAQPQDSFSSKSSFLSGDGIGYNGPDNVSEYNNNGTGLNGGVTKEYEASTFDDIAKSLG